jgi:hypothetical protein
MAEYVRLLLDAVLDVAEAARVDGAVIGVQLCPVDLGAAEAAKLADGLVASLRPVDRVAVAAVGATLASDPERWIVGDGDVVAQRATRWRNASAPGGVVVYVSAERLGRAGGLTDTLRPVDGPALRAAVAVGLARAGLPEVVVAALVKLEIVGPDSLRRTARFIGELDAQGRLVEELLPAIGLLCDSRLMEEPEARLKHNRRVVSALRDGRLAHGNGPTATLGAEVASELRLRGEAALAGLDLGRFSTEELEAELPRRQRQPSGAKVGEAGAKAQPRSAKPKDEAAAPPARARGPRALDSAPVGRPTSARAAVAGQSAGLEGDTGASRAAPPSAGAAPAGDPAGAPEALGPAALGAQGPSSSPGAWPEALVDGEARAGDAPGSASRPPPASDGAVGLGRCLTAAPPTAWDLHAARVSPEGAPPPARPLAAALASHGGDAPEPVAPDPTTGPSTSSGGLAGGPPDAAPWTGPGEGAPTRMTPTYPDEATPPRAHPSHWLEEPAAGAAVAAAPRPAQDVGAAEGDRTPFGGAEHVTERGAPDAPPGSLPSAPSPGEPGGVVVGDPDPQRADVGTGHPHGGERALEGVDHAAAGSPPRPPAPGAPRRVDPAAWGPKEQAKERPAAPPVADGLLRLIMASLEAGGDGLVWGCAGPPAAAAAALPRGLRPAHRSEGAQLPGGRSWADARARMVDLALRALAADGGPANVQALAETLLTAPHTVLGSKRVLAAAQEVVSLARDLFANARASGAEALGAALALETVTLRGPFGDSLTALSPLHPVLLAQALRRVPAAERAKRSVTPAELGVAAAWADRPPVIPASWPGAGAYAGGPRWGPCYGAAPTELGSLEVAAEAVITAYLSVHPHAGLALRVSTEVGAGAVAAAAARALRASPVEEEGRCVVSGQSLRGEAMPEGVGDLVSLEPPTPGLDPHVLLRVGSPGAAPAAPPPAEVAGFAPDGPWRIGAPAPSSIEAAAQPLPSGRSWVALVARRFEGAPPPTWAIIARGPCGPDEVVVLTQELGPLVEHLMEPLGFAPGQASQARRRLGQLAGAHLGVVSLEAGAPPALSPAEAAAEALGKLGDDARLLHVDADLRALLFGGVGGALAVAVEERKEGDRYAFGAHDPKVPLERWAEPAIRRAEQVCALAESSRHARALLRAARGLPPLAEQADELSEP